MILYADDKYVQPYYIQNTTNRSFVKMHVLLERMGVKNNTFFLSLLQPELDGVDPFAEHLSSELIAKIVVECKLNPWYYFREVVRVPSQGGAPIPFHLNRANLALLWLFFSGLSVYLVQPRQTGKTMSTQALVSWLSYIGAEHYNIAMYTITNTLREENVARLRDIRDALPPYLIHKNNKLDTTNKQAMAYAARTTKYITYVCQPDIMAATKIGRGSTAAFTHLDECEYFDNLDITYPSMYSSITTAMKQARANGLPAGVIMTTTTGLLDSKPCQYCIKQISKCMQFTESMYDSKNQTDLHELVKNNSTSKMVYVQYSHRQLGYTDEWLRETARESGSTRDKVLRDYLCVRTSGVDNAVIPIHLLEKIRASEQDPVHVETVDNRYVFRWYEDPKKILNNKDVTLIMGLDTSENIGRDFTSIVMLNSTDMGVACTARCNESDLIRFALFIAEFMIKNPNTLLVPERKSSALTMLGIICRELRKAGINPFTRIFNMIVQNKNEAPFNQINLSEPGLEEGVNKKYLGYNTTGSGPTSRNNLYSNVLMKAIELNHSRIRDRTLITELSGLAQKNGRIDHSVSGHDDTCFIGSTLVRTIQGNVPISELKVGDFVLTREGYKPIRYIYKNMKEVISKYGYVGTPSHPFITPDGVVEFKDLKLWSKVYTWNEKLSCTTESRIIVILTRKALHSVATTIGTIRTKNPLSRFIGRFGKITMDPSQKECISIIRTETRTTTQSKILNVPHQKNTWQDTQCQKKPKRKCLSDQRTITTSATGWNATLNWLMRWPLEMVKLVVDALSKSGEKITQNLLTKSQSMQEKEQHSHTQTLENPSESGELRIQKKPKNCVNEMLTYLKDGKSKIQNWHKKFAPHQLKGRLKQEKRKELVYNLLVDDCHEYFVDDVLVHNCMAYMLSSFFIFFGHNLSYYAINNRMFLNEINYSGERVDKEEKARQEQLLKEVIELRKEIKRVSMSGVLSEPLERRLHHLESLIDNGIVDTTPITSEQATKAMPKYTKPVDLVKMANLYYR